MLVYKKIGISVLITILFVIITGLISNSFFEIKNSIYSFRDIKVNSLLLDAIYVFFGVLLGVPVIIKTIMSSGKLSIDFNYLLVPIILLIIGLYPVLTEKYIYLDYLGFINNSFDFLPLVFIGFGYSFSLLIKKTV